MLKNIDEQRTLVRVRSKATVPSLLIGTLLVWSAIAPQTKAVTFITSRADLNATDRLDWSAVGPIFSPIGPPDPGVFLPSSFTVTSEANRPVQVDIPKTAVPGLLPPFVFQTTPEPGIATNFSSGDFVLFSGLVPGPPPAVGNPGPITLTFDEPVFGAGTQLAVDDIFSFTGTISAFDSNNELLGSFSAPGTSSLALDNSALFLGVVDERLSISKLEFKSSLPDSAIGLNQLSLLTDLSPNKTAVPEPSSLIALSVILAVGCRRGKQHS